MTKPFLKVGWRLLCFVIRAEEGCDEIESRSESTESVGWRLLCFVIRAEEGCDEIESRLESHRGFFDFC